MTRYYFHLFLSSYIDTEVNHKHHFIKIPFINKVIRGLAIDLGLVPEANELRKIPKFYLKLKIINFGIIRKHINDFFDLSSKDRIYIFGRDWDKVFALLLYIVYQ